MSQISLVKQLIQSRTRRGLFQTDPYVDQGQYLSPNTEHFINSYRNPVFCLIFSRYVTIDGKNPENVEQVTKALEEELKAFEKTGFEPEGLIVGPDVYASIGVIAKEKAFPTRFLIEGQQLIYLIKDFQDLSYGLGLTHLYSAMDWVNLGVMPWGAIFDDVSHKLEFRSQKNKLK
jgi:hypothetical protein